MNASEHGYAQRRRRVFIFAYKKNLSFADQQMKLDKEIFYLKKASLHLHSR
nr:DNA cytosine methyltransferase [Lysinibacillus sphaericus]